MPHGPPQLLLPRDLSLGRPRGRPQPTDRKGGPPWASGQQTCRTATSGETLTGLAEVIHGRREASPEQSYTARLLQGEEDELLKKIAEEASEVIMACKDNDHDHIRYEAGDLVYHLMVTLERYGVTLPELAGELDARHK